MRTCVRLWSYVSSTPASSSSPRWRTGGSCSPPPRPSRRRPVGSRRWARSRPRRRPSGSSAGCASARRSPAVPGCGWCRPTPRGCASCGAACSTGSRRSAQPSSRTVRVPPSSPPTGSRAFTGTASRRPLGHAPGAGPRYPPGAAPCRFAAHAAAVQARPRRSRSIVIGEGEARGFLASLPASLLRSRPGAPGAAGDPRSAGHPHARGAGCPALPCRGRALRPSRPAGPRPGLGEGHSTRAAPAPRAGERAARPAGGGSGSSWSAPWSCSWRACSPAASAAAARCEPWPCRRASWPAGPGGRRSRCESPAPMPGG